MDPKWLKVIPPSTVLPERQEREDRLFRHALRPDWGVGLWVAEESTRRRLRFEDGRLRAFKKGYYHLLEPVDPTNEDIDVVFDTIARDHTAAVQEAAALASRAQQDPVMRFDEQIEVWLSLFPQGFKDPSYAAQHRYPEEGSAQQRSHMGAASDLAKLTLSPAALDAIGEDDEDDITSRVTHVLRNTSFVPSTKIAVFAALEGDERAAFGTACHDLLHGSDPYRDRFNRWLKALAQVLGQPADWAIASALPTLYDPERYVYVRAQILSLQARAVLPGVRVSKSPDPRAQQNARRIALATRRTLEEAGHPVEDLMDVAIFTWETLRPKGRARLENLRTSSST